MGKHYRHSTFQTLSILGLGVILLLAQANRLHMHLVHDEHPSGHAVDVHASSIMHNFELIHHHADQINHQNDHHLTAVDFQADSLIPKAHVLNPLILILLVIGLSLLVPRLTCRIRQRFYKRRITPYYYFFQPPLRAPPVTYYG